MFYQDSFINETHTIHKHKHRGSSAEDALERSLRKTLYEEASKQDRKLFPKRILKTIWLGNASKVNRKNSRNQSWKRVRTTVVMPFLWVLHVRQFSVKNSTKTSWPLPQGPAPDLASPRRDPAQRQTANQYQNMDWRVEIVYNHSCSRLVNHVCLIVQSWN